MPAKPVKLTNGLEFDQAGNANAFYREILNKGELGAYLSNDDAAAVDVLFRDYCAATNWQMPGQPERYLRDWNMAEKRATRSFYVEYADGERDDFSYIKAVRAVANWKRMDREPLSV